MYRVVCQILIVCFLELVAVANLHAQCTVVDAATPYVEDFEATNGNWVSGGTSSDWVWGQPAKPTITGAAAGQKCWITGNLTGSAYNAGERSYITSPCFDFTNLQYPYIEFNVFWETEYKYDGASFQYSLNNGASWANVGSVSEPPNCLTTNWFNTASVNNLTGLGPNKEGWSGTIKPSSGSCSGGNGSGNWVLASHAMSNLAGKPSVKFRFTFGSGTTCNAYDGFAIDNIKITNSPPNSVDFISNCVGNRRVAFTNTSSLCFGAFNWDFGDPASGSANTATSFNATHNFSAPGSYTVTLTGSGGGGPAVTVAKQIHVMDVQANISQPISCSNSNNGAATALVIADTGVKGISYTWNTTPLQTTSIISGLSPGTYIVTVSASNACAASDTVTITSPLPLAHNVVKTDVTCNNANGSIIINESGGTKPYTYTWSPAVSSGDTAMNLSPGLYIISITDNAGCTDSVHVQINPPLQPLQHSVVVNNISCTNAVGSATITASGGKPPYAYSWSPTGGTGAFATGLAVGNYVVTITDNNSCVDTAQIQIINTSTVVVSISNIIAVSCSGGSNGAATASATGVAPFSFVWSPIGGNGATATNLSAGNYTVKVTDNTGCSSTATVQITSPLPIDPAITALTTTCGFSNGTAIILATGGTPPFAYNWMPGNLTGDTIRNLSADTYNLTITDANGCTATGQAIINGSSSPSANVIAVSTTCNTTNGRATVTVTNGTSPYTYLWVPGSYTTATINNLAPGSYTVTVTDAKGCKNNSSGFIKPSTAPVIRSITPVDALCSGKPSGSASAVVTGGILPYRYNWSNGFENFTTASLRNVLAGIYQLAVSDSAGCTDTKTTTISEPQAMQFAISTTPATCGVQNASAWANVIGGTAPYSFLWSSGSIGDTARNLGGGGVSVDVTDGNGCVQASGLIPIQASEPLRIGLGNDTIICPGSKVVLYPGDFAAYRWQDNSTDSVFTATQTGTYFVNVVDSFGCNATASIRVEVNCRDIVFPDAFTPNGDKRNDEFGPLGTLSAISDYSLTVFNRWGQAVFTSTNPFRKWNGTTNGVLPGAGAYVWIASYSFDRRPKKTVKGTIVLIK